MNQEHESEKPEVVDMSDADIERLLGDAYVVPPVPQTLLKRLEGAVGDQWGESPQVVRSDARRWTRVSGRVVRSWKTWPVAACVVLALILALVFRGDAHAYSWNAVVEAMSKQSVILIGGRGAADSETSWLSISEKKLGRRSGNVEQLYDLADGVILERSHADSQIKRARLSDSAAAADRNRLALSFLAGGLSAIGDPLNLGSMRVTEESWTRVGEAVELTVKIGTGQEADELRLSLTIDPKTSLPQKSVIADRTGKIHENTFTYPATSPAELMVRAFPANVPIVDVSSGELLASNRTIADLVAPGEKSAVDKANTVTDGNRATTLTGLASLGWSPIVASRISNQQTVDRIDSLLEQLWRANNVTPARPASDAELMRRVYLDLAGRAPTVAEVRSYLNDPAPDRYPRLVDRLLTSRDHATHLATVWRTFLLPEGVDLTRFGGVPAFDEWLSGRFGNNVSYDQLVRELLLAEGRLSQSGPLLFYSAAKLDADQLAARTARVFLGMRLDCAQCHNDPFEPWTQEDFWSYAAFFARISRPQAALESVSTVMRVRDVDRGEVMMPESKTPVPPKFPDGTNLDETPAAAARRHQLARWLTGPDNPYFARAAVNRVWAHMFGRGIVDPVDGFGRRYPPRSPELLDLLAAQFVANKFNLRETFRAIALTRAYQLSSGAETGDAVRQDWFAQMNIKMLTAEQTYDCITVASMLVASDATGFSIERIGNASRDEFLQQFKTLAGRPTEYQSGIPQALTLMNGTLIYSATDLAGSGLLKSLEAPFFTDDQRIEVIYLATLSRQPTASEWAVLRDYLKGRDPKTSIQEPLADILWALLNGAEFTMNH